MDNLNLDLTSLELTEPIFKDVKFYISGEVVPEVIELLKKGGAERMNYFGDYVTHMLCGRDTEDTDLSDANEVYEVPAVTVKWVYMCARLKRLVSTKPYLYSTSKLFDNCVFCLSKPEGDLKALWAMITYYGGVVQMNLDNRCTHLVTVYTNTAKYEKAASLGSQIIAIITPDWIVESIRHHSLVQADLFHPKLIQWPKVIKHESTTSITGFEPPEQETGEENLLETAPPDSTQALLDKLKQRMPWNQPQTATTTDIVPPNVVAPSYTQNNKLPQMEQMRLFNQQQQQQQQQLNVAPQQQQALSSSVAFQQTAPNVVISNQQLPRSVVHHTAQPQQFAQQQQQSIFQQLSQQQGQLNLSRLIGQQQQRPNLQTSMAQQLNKLNQLNQQQQTQFAQQLLQRNQQTLLQNQQQVVPNQVIQQQQQQQQPTSVVQQNLIQRTAALGQLNKLQQLPHAQVIQHIQQIGGNRQQITTQLIQNQQQIAQQLNQNQQLLQQQNQVLTQQQINQNQVIVQQSQQLLSQNQQLLQQKQQQLLQQQQNQQQNQQLLQQQQQQQQQFANVVQQSPQTIEQQLNQNQSQQQQQPQQQQQQIGLIQNKIAAQNQFSQPQQSQQQSQQQFVSTPSVNQPQQQQFVQNQQHFVQQQPQQQQQQQQQQTQQFGQTQQLLQQQQQQPQQLTGQPQLLNHQQLLINQQQTQQQFNQQQGQPTQTLQQRPINQHLWQQQQQQQQGQPPPVGIRHPGAIVQQTPQGPRVQWSPNQQQRQFIQLDAQTHQQLQQMAPEQRAAFVAKLQKQRQLLLQRQQIQMQQQRGGHILIRGSVPPGLNPQQQMQWLQQQAKQQGVVLQSNIQQTTIAPTQEPPQPPLPQNIQHAAPGLSPIQQQTSPLFAAAEQQKRQQLQLQQQQYRLQQLQLQREQAQKNAAAVAAAAAAVAQQQGGLVGPQPAPQQQQQPPVVVPPPPPPPPPQGNVVRPIGQPQPAEVAAANVVDQNIQQHPLVVNAKTKTALANMLSIRLQSGGATMGPGPETIAEPSAAGTLRLMTAQHNAALNSAARPQDLLALQQRRQLSTPAPPDLVRPPPTPVVPQSPQGEPPKLQYSPRPAVPLQHRPGTFYGHNPNLKLPPDLFLLGCIFVVVEVEKYLEETMPGWQQKIEKHGGEIEPQYCSRVTHVLCETQRHGVVMQALRDYKRCVTLYWLSDVIKRKQVLPPWTALHLPTMYLDTTPAAKHLISLSGFSGSDRNRVKHMIKYTGASFTSYFSKHNTLLICAKAEGPKYMHSKKWGTPAVNVQWLTDVMLGNFSALNQMEHVKFQQFNNPPNFSFDPILVPNLMQAWKMPINISQESYERVKRSSSPVLMPKKKKLKTENIDENDNETYVPATHHKILFSMCADVEELKKIVKQLGGALATDHNDCTHLIMPYLARTNKLLYAVCRGIHILPEAWLKDSQIVNKFLDETNYTFDTKEFNCSYKCDFNQTLNTKNRNKLFEGRYFFVTPSVVPSKNVVVDLIHSCGGVVERIRRSSAQIEATNVNSPYSYVIITHENDLHLVADLFKNKKEKVQTVCNVELILSAILKQTFEVEPYAVKIL